MVAEHYKSEFMETSALTGEGVNEVFEIIARSILKKKHIAPQIGKENNVGGKADSIKLTDPIISSQQ